MTTISINTPGKWSRNGRIEEYIMLQSSNFSTMTVGAYIDKYGSDSTKMFHCLDQKKSVSLNGANNVDQLIIVNKNLHFWTVQRTTTIQYDQIKCIFETLDIDVHDHIFDKDDDYTVYPDDLWLLVLIQFYAKDSIIDVPNGYLTFINKNMEVKLFQPSFEYNKTNPGYFRSELVGETKPVSEAAGISTTDTVTKEWIPVQKGELVEIPAGIRSIKVSMGAAFKMYDNIGSCRGIIEDGGDLLFKIQEFKKPYFVLSLNDIARLYFVSGAVIKFSKDKYPVVHLLYSDYVKRLKPNTEYKIYFDKNHKLSNESNITMGAYTGHTVVKTDEKGKLPNKANGAAVMFE